MASTGTYLTFPGTCEEAFGFYKTVFGTEYQGGVMRMGDGPMYDDGPQLTEADKQLVMNVALPILGGHVIMGSDMPSFMGTELVQGNAFQIVLDPDTRAEADRLFAALAEGGTVRDPLQEMFWGDYYGALVDRYGVQWLVNCTSKV
jgi:PhnB protein